MTRRIAWAGSTRWPPRARRAAAAVVALTLASGIGGCGSGDVTAPDQSRPPDTDDLGNPGTGPEVRTTDAPSGAVVAPEVFAGEAEAFYDIPDPLPPGEPGQLIRIQELGAGDGRRSVRVLYHSRDAADRDRAVSGVITYPTTPPPADGWPVVAWAHGTTGLAPACAPSRTATEAPGFGIDGVWVATDYIGLGPNGERHAYLSGVSESNSVIDSVRAARNLDAAGAGSAWVSVGHSQGGHAALFTNQRGEQYAPELDLRGTIAIAPAAVLDRTFGPEDQIVPNMVGLMAMYGLATDYDELDPDDFVSDEIAARAPLLDELCTDDFVLAVLPVPVTEFYDTDPLVTEPARTILHENDPGQVAVDSPLLVVSGTADTWVVPARVDELLRRVCASGQVVDHLVVDGGDHGSVVHLRADDLTAWLQARLDGKPMPTACPLPPLRSWSS